VDMVPPRLLDPVPFVAGSRADASGRGTPVRVHDRLGTQS
jgi:hypothetical protein